MAADKGWSQKHIWKIFIIAAGWTAAALLSAAAAGAATPPYVVHLQQVNANNDPIHRPDEIAWPPKTETVRFRIYVEAADSSRLPYRIRLGNHPKQSSRVEPSITALPESIDKLVFLSPAIKINRITQLAGDVPRLAVIISGPDNRVEDFYFSVYLKELNLSGANVLYTEKHARKRLLAVDQPVSKPSLTPSPSPTARQATPTNTATSVPVIAPLTVSVRDAVEVAPGTWRSRIPFARGKQARLAIDFLSDSDPKTQIEIGGLTCTAPGFMLVEQAERVLLHSARTAFEFHVTFPDTVSGTEWSFTASVRISLKLSYRGGSLAQDGMTVNGAFYARDRAAKGIEHTMTITFPVPAAPTQPAATAPPASATPTPTVAAGDRLESARAAAVTIKCDGVWRVGGDGTSDPYFIEVVNESAVQYHARMTIEPPGFAECGQCEGTVSIAPRSTSRYALNLTELGRTELEEKATAKLDIALAWTLPEPGRATAAVTIEKRDLLLISLLAIGGMGLIGAFVFGAYAFMKAEVRKKYKRVGQRSVKSSRMIDDGHKAPTLPPLVNRGLPMASDDHPVRLPAAPRQTEPSILTGAAANADEQAIVAAAPADQPPSSARILPARRDLIEKTIGELERRINALQQELDESNQRAVKAESDAQKMQQTLSARLKQGLGDIQRQLVKVEQRQQEALSRAEFSQLLAVLRQESINRASELEWVMNTINTLRAGGVQFVEIEAYGEFLDLMFARTAEILQRLHRTGQFEHELSAAAGLFERCERERAYCREMFSRALHSVKDAPGAGGETGGGSVELLRGTAAAGNGDQLLDALRAELVWFQQRTAGLPASGDQGAALAGTSHAFREEILRTVFADLAGLLWDVGLAFPKEARDEVTALLTQLYQRFGVKWIWPVTKKDMFNPEQHLRVGEKPSTAPVNTILEVVRPGVLDGHQVLVPAHVRTSQGR